MISELFSYDDIEEIEVLKELFQDMTVDNEIVNCFEILLDIINEKKSIDDFTRKDLLKLFQQIKQSNEYFENIHWVDNQILKNLIPKFRKYILNILNRKY